MMLGILSFGKTRKIRLVTHLLQFFVTKDHQKPLFVILCALASCSAERLKRAYVKSDKDARGGIRTLWPVEMSPATPLFL